jgi:hypothetical protein
MHACGGRTPLSLPSEDGRMADMNPARAADGLNTSRDRSQHRRRVFGNGSPWPGTTHRRSSRSANCSRHATSRRSIGDGHAPGEARNVQAHTQQLVGLAVPVALGSVLQAALLSEAVGCR